MRCAQCCVDRIAQYIRDHGCSMDAKMGARANVLSQPLRKDPHFGSLSRRAKESTEKAAGSEQERQTRLYFRWRAERGRLHRRAVSKAFAGMPEAAR